jgi:hypothetical protein
MTTTNNEGVLTESPMTVADAASPNGTPSAATPTPISSSTSIPAWPSTWPMVSPEAFEDTRVRIGLGGAVLLMLLASILTAIVVRRRADARARKVLWLTAMSSARGGLMARARATR